MPEWRNWSGSVSAAPQRIERPTSEAQLSAIVTGAPRVRVAGAGHSFMPLCETDGVLISLADMEGGLEVASDRSSVWVPAGLPIGQLTAALWAEGLSMANQGDIDKQAIASARHRDARHRRYVGCAVDLRPGLPPGLGRRFGGRVRRGARS